METTLGGERLGSGNKQKVSMRNYERSTHDLGYVWRSTMASGTLVPFMCELALSGDTFDINLDALCKTHPTIGPLFGTFKIQLDVFSVPMRLYNGKLHMNKLGIGMDMSAIKLPQIEMYANTHPTTVKNDNDQINPSSIWSYLNIRGLGINKVTTNLKQTNYRRYNAIPYLAYWDIYKNYYANKQEEIGAVIHNPLTTTTMVIQPEETNVIIYNGQNPQPDVINIYTANYVNIGPIEDTSVEILMTFDNSIDEIPDPKGIIITLEGVDTKLSDIFSSFTYDKNTGVYKGTNLKLTLYNTNRAWVYKSYNGSVLNPIYNPIRVKTFPLENIDTMRENILVDTKNVNAFVIDEDTVEPYGLSLGYGTVEIPNNPDLTPFTKLMSQEGLAVKTYQSDLFNNWVSTEWIDGTNGINEITAIDTSGGSFNIDTLNLSNKVYNMLNRIAISGGTYDDWLDAVYTHERVKSIENPMYMGGLIRELGFEEIVSSVQNEMDGVKQPLGQLAGKGDMTGKKKGGTVRIKVDEPSYIIGIVSLTPRLDYSQGNKWDVNLKTFNDFHKPALDEIGFQDLITDQMAWFDTDLDANDTPVYKSAGKQPAWINYMTNVNQVRGNFASDLVSNDNLNGGQMYMTLNRKYENEGGSIGDLTTYIDPSKFNHIFADTRLDAQNFWMQISVDITARRKMSAKVIPNL